VKSNPTRESNTKTPPLYPFQLSPNVLKPESYAILCLILVRYGCSNYVFMLCTTCLYAYDYTPSYPNYPKPPDSPSTSTYDYTTPTLVRFRRASRIALPSTDVR
jgi:hypothetical protein